MNDAEYLFSVPDLPHVLEARQQEARQAIEEWDPDKLLVTAEANVVRLSRVPWNLVATSERGVTVDHVTIYRWVQRFTPGVH